MVKLSRKERDQELRREDLLAAAERLFAEKGYYHTTMEDIARTAEYGTGTIYLYFKRKEDLYEVLLERKITEYIAHMQEAVESAAAPADKVRMLIRAKLAFFENHREFFRIYLAQSSTLDTTLRKCPPQWAELFEAHRCFVEQTLREAMQAGAIRRMDADQLALAFIGLINPLLSERIKTRSKTSLAELEEFILNLLWHGVETPS